MPPVSGAWESERREGIGYRQTEGQTWAYRTWSDNPTIARREAAAMRSRAYQRRWPGGAHMDRADHWPTPAR